MAFAVKISMIHQKQLKACIFSFQCHVYFSQYKFQRGSLNGDIVRRVGFSSSLRYFINMHVVVWRYFKHFVLLPKMRASPDIQDVLKILKHLCGTDSSDSWSLGVFQSSGAVAGGWKYTRYDTSNRIRWVKSLSRVDHMYSVSQKISLVHLKVYFKGWSYLK